jgi:ubiquitin-conjugating enzyme E2 variant
MAYLMSDFAVGIYHWVKDTYFKFDTPFLGPAFITPSRTHHVRPRHVLEFSDWELFWNSVKWMIPTYIPFFYYLGINTFTISFFIIVALNDVIHKYAHMIDKERPWFPTLLQKLYITQTYGEHHYHHTAPHDCNYCPITPWVNYVLEKHNFWRRFEDLIERHTGIKPRDYELKFKEDEKIPGGIRFIN